ncbi:MAG: DUF1631 family protein [Candidatus Thiodiazotropha sp.]
MNNQRNRRRYPRLDVDIPATIEYQSRHYSNCRMLNFSRGGVYLQCQDEALTGALPQGYLPEHQRESVLLSLPDESLAVCAHVVYFSGEGMGLAFCDNEGEKLYESLYARRSANADSEEDASVCSPAQSRELVNQLKQNTEPFLEAGLTDFFSSALQELQYLITDSSDRQEESSLFYALNSLEKDQATIRERFLQLAGRNYALLLGEETAQQPTSEQAEDLALVDTHEVDTWILINKLARRIESDNARNLYHIESALSYLCQDNVHNELNPIAPISLLTIIKKILDCYQFNVSVTRVLLNRFCKTLLSDLGLLYEELLQLLRQQKIIGLEREVQERWTIVKSPEPTHAASSPIENITALNNLKPADDESTSIQSMTETERNGVLTSLTSLSRLQTASLQQQIQQLLQEESTKPVELSDEARAAIGAGEELVATLCKDPLITDELRALLSSLKFLVVEAVLRDTNLLNNGDHPVRRLLDSIESMKPYINRGNRASLLRDRDSRRFAAITESVEGGRYTQVDDVTAEIEALQHEQQERFETNRKLSISRCLKDEKLRQAQTATFEALSNLLLEQSIDPLIDKLFRFGWVNLLIQTAVLEKADDKGWLNYLQIVELLHKLLSDTAGKKHKLTDDQRHALLSMIRKGFTDYPIYADQALSFEQELLQKLGNSANNDSPPHQSITVDEAYLDQYFQGMDIHPASVPQDHGKGDWQHRINEIALDTWLVQQSDEANLRILSLAWKNPQTGRYLLVDGDGYKVLDEELPYLAERFAEQQIYPMEMEKQPIVERTVETILSNSYDSFKHESAIDSLTGLSNRRTFETELSRHISLMDDQEEAGILILLNLDKFQVVNNLCGFEGGDNLLQKVTDILLNYMPEKGYLGRIGDDEFSLLLPGHDLEDGYRVAEMLRQAIYEYDFEWQGMMIPSTTSVGVVEIGSNKQRADRLLQAAVAACNRSKQAGGNCTRVYLESDSTYQEHQQLVESLPAIKEALAKGRLELFVQPIVPLQELEGLSPHHEILLRVRNDAGNLESPFAFIRAAEEYDLMRDVDRWVVEAFFSQVEPYADRLPEGESFSINLSGMSVGDDEFKNRLIERIKASPLQARQIGFEITETVLVGDVSDTAAAINEIRQLGCSFSLDDFGSGYASFSYLRDFPVDFVKIDGIFVREILNKPADYAMINSITEIAHFMDKQVIAEFVSDEITGSALKNMGVDYGQGYHFGKPRPLQEMLAEIVDEKGEVGAL